MPKVTITADTYSDSAHPSTNYLAANRLRLQGSGATAYGYLMVKPPVTGADVLYTSAVVRVFAATTWGACTLTGRRVTSLKSFSTITANALPSSTGTGAGSVVVSSAAVGDAIDLDITTLVQGWASGAFANYGLRLDKGATAADLLYAAQTTTSSLRPVLVYTVFRKPSVPTVTAPKAGQQVSIARPTLTWTPPSDPLMAQVSYQVQMNATDVWTSPTYDSTEVASTAGQHLVTFDINDAETWFWRLRVKNGGGQWSDWSTGQEFGRTDKPTFTITQPAGGVWTDSTPPVIWSALSAGTQIQYQVQHLVDGVVKVDSKVLPGADTSWTYAKPIPGFDSGEVTTRVSLRTDIDYVATPGDSPWIVMEETWTYTPGATDPVDTIVVAEHAFKPIPVIAVTRSTAPDRWDVQRSIESGPFESVAIVDGPDASTGGDEYQFLDPTAPPYRDLAYRVVAGNNGIDSDVNPVGLVRVESNRLWLLDANDDEFWVAMADQDSLDSLTYSEDSEATYVKGASAPQVIFDALHGFQGSVSGGVYGTEDNPDLGRTAQEMRDAFITKTKLQPTAVLRFIAMDYNIPVIVQGATPILRPQAELNFGLAMSLSQVGEFPWD